MNDTLLQVRDLRKYYQRTKGLTRRVVATVKAVDGISFDIQSGETLALVGESGCGKTTTGKCIMRAVEPTAGQVLFSAEDGSPPVEMTSLDKEGLKQARKHMAMVFQDPNSSLNPRMNILETVSEPLVIHRLVRRRRDMEERVAELLRLVGLNPDNMNRYPHAFSGGQRQRIALARALSMNPRFIVADEAVSALDVSVQAQVLNLFKELQSRLGLTYLFIAHNLAVVEYMANRVAVMYVGKIVELTNTAELFLNPKHPYTEALLSAVPRADPKHKKERIILQGDVADPADPPTGCSFHPRCPYAEDICRTEEPPLVEVTADNDQQAHYAACHFAEKLALRGIEIDLRRVVTR